MPHAERFLNVSPVREVSSAPNSRSCSFKKAHRRPRDLELMGPECRPRTNSLPSCSRRQRHASDGSGLERDRELTSRLCRVRLVEFGSEEGGGRGYGRNDDDDEGSSLKRDMEPVNRLCCVRLVKLIAKRRELMMMMMMMITIIMKYLLSANL